MRRPSFSGRFRKDVKLAEKRPKDMSKSKAILALLVEGSALPPHYRDHALRGEWTGFRDAHIEPDWLLIYRIDGNNVCFERTGRHGDPFNE
jgi:mRNA interferase YafQ